MWYRYRKKPPVLISPSQNNNNNNTQLTAIVNDFEENVKGQLALRLSVASNSTTSLSINNTTSTNTTLTIPNNDEHDSLLDALKINSLSPPINSSLFIPPSVEADELFNHTPPPNTKESSMMTSLLKSMIRSTTRSSRTVDRISNISSNIPNTLRLPTSDMPVSPIKASLQQDLFEKNTLHFEPSSLILEDNNSGEGVIEGKVLEDVLPTQSLNINTQYSGHEPIAMPDSFISDDNPFERKAVHFASQDQFISQSTINTTITEAPKEEADAPKVALTDNQNVEGNKLVSPSEILKAIDNGALEEKYVKQMRRSGNSLALISTPQLKAVALNKLKQIVPPPLTTPIRTLNSTQKIVIKVSKPRSEPKKSTKAKSITITQTPISKTTKSLKAKSVTVIHTPISKATKQGTKALIKEKTAANSEVVKGVRSPASQRRNSISASFHVNDLVWLKWKHDLYLVGKLESKPSSTRELWSCKYLFQNKLSMPHSVPTAQLVPITNLTNGSELVVVESKSKQRYTTATFRGFEGEFARISHAKLPSLVKLKTVAIHRKVFQELTTESPFNNDLPKTLKSTAATTNTNIKKTAVYKVVLSGTADKKSVKDLIRKKKRLELVDDVKQADVLISEGKRTAKHLHALILGLPINQLSWLETTAIPKEKSPISPYLEGKSIMLLGDVKFQKDWRPLVESLGGTVNEKKPTLVIRQSEKYQLRASYQREWKECMVLMASVLAEMIVNNDFGLLK